MNCIPAIMKELGLEKDECFKVKGYDGIFRFINTDLIWDRTDVSDKETTDVLEELIHDYAEVIKLPWKPKKEEGYYFIDFNGMIEKVYFADDSLFDLLNYKVGNCFRTQEKAEKNKLKIYEMLNKEGVLHE